MYIADFDRLLAAGYELLVLTAGRAFIAKRDAVFRRQTYGPAAFAIVDLRQLDRRLRNMVDRNKTYDLASVAAFMGVRARTAYMLLEAGLIRPTVGKERCAVKRFAYLDALVAGIVGSLHRNGVPPRMLAAVPKALYGPLPRELQRVAAGDEAQSAEPVGDESGNEPATSAEPMEVGA